jgi:mRNA interferase HigB
MTLVGEHKLDSFVQHQHRARGPIRAWRAEARKANWIKPIEIKDRYRSAGFLSNNRVIFNIGGNKYTLLVEIAYKLSIVVVIWVGTHRQYDKMKF